MSDESIKSSYALNRFLHLTLKYHFIKTILLIFSGSYLKQDKITYDHRKIVIIQIAHEIRKKYNLSSYPTLENCLFGVLSLTKMLIFISIIFWIWYWI